MSKNTRILIAALVALAIVGCSVLAVVWLVNRGGEEAPADPLGGTKWQAHSLALGEGGSLVLSLSAKARSTVLISP